MPVLLLDRLSDLPQAHDPDQAARGIERFGEAVAEAEDAGLSALAGELLADRRGRRLLEALFGNSPYLTACLVRDVRFFGRILKEDPDALLAEQLERLPGPATPLADLMARLRAAKRRVALLTAIADIGGFWPLEQVTAALSDLAAGALHAAAGHLLLAAANEGDMALPDPADPCHGSGLALIAMGKLGARELNYSSDIDIIVLYDQETVPYRGRREIRDFFVRMTQGLVRLMQERTSDGYVFRTDLRLRPDPAATPVAISMEAAETYYESLGQNWERAAMIKARAIAGDIEAGRGFLERIAPFVWRKNLDFAAIEDIHSIKRQIHAHKGHSEIAVPGHNIKVGRGGIREIEFFAQTQQLILGGRVRQLRISTTCGALRALVQTGRLEQAVATELIAAYEFLRRVEHRLQMIDDEQTQTLPETTAGLSRLATFLGFADAAAFSVALTEVLRRVQAHYAALFEASPDLGAEEGSLVFTGTEDDPDTIRTLARMGYGEVSMVAATIRGWHHGRYRAMRSVRARELLTALMPRLLQALARTASPDDAFRRFDDFLSKLPAGVQLFSLFYNNPELLDLVALVMGSAPRLSERLSRQPGLFDNVLAADFADPLPDADRLTEDLRTFLETARDFQDILDFTRRFANDRRFQVGVQALRRRIDIEEEGRALTAIAEAVLRNLLDFVGREFARQHGRLTSGGMTIIGLGKFGAGEMTFGSDLDLIFVYDHDPEAEQSDGRTQLAPSQYFTRLSQRIINALTALTGEGVLYEVDMRLRPSGNKGPIAVHFDGLARYQREEAWTWEHMALTRGRVVGGPDELRARCQALLAEILARPRDPDKLRVEVLEMHAKLMAQHGTDDPWNIKHANGGLVDAEFLAQYLVLRHGADDPALVTGNTALAFRRLGTAGKIDRKVAEALARDTLLLRALQAMLRLCFDSREDGARMPPGLERLLASVGGTGDFAGLEKALVEAQARIRASFDTWLRHQQAGATSGQQHGV
ncbi:MAG: bifunctional [glutamine synthetase] adenylyltransferase/[glutamine synthetase]-adenylyl-L-tyrosine phosphorylase [Alphaproteobacteria bacterium]|nr:bifunctional [glutamine synthetase] adenylyltransferase/[glutamine synthetase]-adenylyl-L-tyrosine phosphorylase [Alphaproteobacteria bacterium]